MTDNKNKEDEMIVDEKHGIDADFIKRRITELRKQKCVSEYQMGRDLGFSRSYIQNIIGGVSMPSWDKFFKICDYFEIHPSEFLDNRQENPIEIKQMLDKMIVLDSDSRKIVLALLDKINGVQDKGSNEQD